MTYLPEVWHVIITLVTPASVTVHRFQARDQQAGLEFARDYRAGVENMPVACMISVTNSVHPDADR